ncbi:aspartate ammonia-lyase [uncultured Mailhella sp.]|uniref:aspartate ammonia-lyase n=1 Tax=uncultured Mailhella sp. TaxID=1981031 RepID=UPI00262B5A1C|nr:aspartate ammonia-lyase [uncultured Mailhella sp.]
MPATRREHDFLGELDIPAGAYYGIQTSRAVENFQISGIRISSLPRFVQAFGYVKKAAALANMELGALPDEIGRYICLACDRLIAGEYADQFPVDVFQGGAGTSCNMNANEVIANIALELMGRNKGEYQFCHPNNHVNCSQSTNDVYPTAIRLALYTMLTDFMKDMEYLRDGFALKAEEFRNVLKMGRTQMQDAVPMTLGMEFSAWAATISEDIRRVGEGREQISDINMGATAIGTGINTPRGYAALVTRRLADLSGLPVFPAENLVEATFDAGAYVQISGLLKRFVVKLSKICNDLRLLSSGPCCGFNEINLPPRQPGSSIMPGKVNPVIPEVVNQVCFDVIGKDVTISMAAEAGQLELNAMEPVIAYSLFSSLLHLGRACHTLRDLCVDGITANAERCASMMKNAIGLVTALTPYIGYERCSAVAREALNSGASVYDLVIRHGYMTGDQIDAVLSPDRMLQPGEDTELKREIEAHLKEKGLDG